GLVVYPEYNKDGQAFLNALTGVQVEPFKQEPRSLLAESTTFQDPPRIALENGWELSGFKRGTSKTLHFREQGSALDKWVITPKTYPDIVRTWKNNVYVCFSELKGDGVLYAYKAGDKNPSWTLDLNREVRGVERLERMFFQVIDDTL